MTESDKKLCRRLNLVLDSVSFETLEKIKHMHGDATYTAAIKRAIAITFFIEQQAEQGKTVFIRDKNGNLREITFVN